MTSILTSVTSAIAAVGRGLTLPLLRGIGGIFGQFMQPAARALAAACLVIAAVALASDMDTALTGGPRIVHATPVVRHWQDIAPRSLEQTRSFLSTRTRPWVWDAVSAPLRLPSFVFFCGLGALFGYLGRHRRRVEIFIN